MCIVPAPMEWSMWDAAPPGPSCTGHVCSATGSAVNTANQRAKTADTILVNEE